MPSVRRLNSRPRRMAMEDLPSAERSIVRQALMPWNRILGRRDSDQQNRVIPKLWQGTTPEGFVIKHDNLVDDLVDDMTVGSASAADDRAVDKLIREYRYIEPDAEDEIKKLRYAISRGRENQYDLGALRVGVPSAEADEQLSAAALKLSGWTDVSSPKDQGSMSTDLLGVTPAGERLLIDAQSRVGGKGDLNISIMDTIYSEEDLQKMFEQAPNNQKLMDFVRQARDVSRRIDPQSAREGKLMQTIDENFNDNPTDYFYDRRAINHKDALISSDRKGWMQFNPQTGRYKPHPDHPRFAPYHTPFNPTLPKGWETVDLRSVRNLAEGLTMESIKNKQSPIRVFSPRAQRGYEGAKYGMSLALNPEILNRLRGSLGELSAATNEVMTAL